MSIELRVPEAGESITEVTIVEWVKGEGSEVGLDETIAVIETDKANVELPAPSAGRLTKILKQAGDTAEVGEVIGYMESGGASVSPSRPARETAPSALRAEPPRNGRSTSGRTGPDVAEAGRPAAPAGASAMPPAPVPPAGRGKPRPPPPAVAVALGAGSAEPDANTSALTEGPTADLVVAKASPSVRRQIRERGLDPAALQPSGPDGRIWPSDLELRPQARPVGGSREKERVRMTPLRRRIAERLVQAQEVAALLTTFNEIDMTEVIALRKRFQETFVKKHGIKLGFMSFFVKAAVEALKAFPGINGRIDGDEIVYHDYCDIGVAVGGGRGLVVPIIRNAERLSFAQVEETIADFGARARDNRLKVDELKGGTFTISNGGIYGSLMSTPIINPPQSGILGMHAIQERPVAVNGTVEVRKMMYVALTYDHRLVDGREAVTFLVRIKELVENPTRLLLEV